MRYRRSSREVSPAVEHAPQIQYNGKVATYKHLFSKRKEIALTWKMLGRDDDDLGSLFDHLITDLTRVRPSWRGGLDGGWVTTYTEFCTLGPAVKGLFEGVTALSLKRFLLDYRKEILRVQAGQGTDPEARKRHLRRTHRNSSKTEQDIRCTDPLRLTPLDSSLYNAMSHLVARRKYGTDVYTAKMAGYRSMAPCLTSSGFGFYVNRDTFFNPKEFKGDKENHRLLKLVEVENGIK